MSNATKCITCDRSARSRGLCASCFITARRLIVAGKTTDESLVQAGLLLPAKFIGGKRENYFLTAFEALKKPTA